jgi:hypothetical protein
VELLPSEAEGCLRIIASSFNRIGTQFVRYDTGDLAMAADGSCDNHFLRVGAIVGRSQETFIDGSGRRRALGPYVFGIHGPFWDQIRDLQVVQDRVGLLRVRLVASPGADKEQIQRTMERRMPMVRLEFDYVPAIARYPSGKRRYFVDGLQALQAVPPTASPREAGAARLSGRERRMSGRRWLAAASVAVAAAAAVVSFVMAGLGSGSHHGVAHAHRVHAPIVNVRAHGHNGIEALRARPVPLAASRPGGYGRLVGPAEAAGVPLAGSDDVGVETGKLL